MTQDQTTISGILIYETSLSFLKDAGDESSRSEVVEVRRTVEGYILSMTSDDGVGAIIASLECRQRVLELANKLELTNDPGLRTALRRDEEQMTTLLVSILNSKSDEERVLRLEGDSAQHFLDVVQETLDSGFIVSQEHTRMALRIVRKLSESCDILPSSLFIVGVEERDEHPTFGGGFGDIYRALYGGQRVALKRMRHFLRGSDLRRIRLKFCREALVWKDLHHPNILPFLGIDRDSFPSALCMVSPWMKHGTVINYLKTHGFANVDKLLYEIAKGLEYLHSHNLVHGDLRGANILIKEDWSACLSDFGLSFFSDATSTMSTNRGGSLYWMAPELLDPDRFNLKFARTPATDVYAFGCVCVELYTARPPFSSMSETAALLKVLNGERPERPPGPPAMSDPLWQHVTEFWAESPTARPSTQSVARNMVWPKLDPQSLDLSFPTSKETQKTNKPIPSPSSLSRKSESLREIMNTMPTGAETGEGGGDVVKAPTKSGVTPTSGTNQYKAKALYSYKALRDDELSFDKDEILDIVDKHVVDKQDEWWEAKNADGDTGLVPSNFLVIIPPKTPETTSTSPISASSTAAGEEAENYQYEVKALYPYKGSEDDPNELSFDKGEILHIVNTQGTWWRAKNADGYTGIVPSNFLVIIPTESHGTISTSPTSASGTAAGKKARKYQYKAKALYSYKALRDGDLSFDKDEIIRIVNPQGIWWQAKNAAGKTGIVPSNFVVIIRTEGRVSTSPTSASGTAAGEEAENYQYKAKALYGYEASKDDELSFDNGEIIHIVNPQGIWWQAKNAAGKTGIVPFNHVVIIPAKSRETTSTSPISASSAAGGAQREDYQYKARALCDCTASKDDELSFARNEILHIVNTQGIWWHAKNAAGKTGIVPSEAFVIIPAESRAKAL